MNMNELAKKVRELKELKTMAEELAAEISGIEDNIKALMLERGLEEMKVDVYTIRWKPVTSSRIDSTSLKKAMPELYNQFAKQTTSRRFSVV